MDAILEKIGQIGIIPVIALDDAKDALPLASALIKGGLCCAEVTFRTAAAEESIRLMSHEFPGLLVGAGTVLSMEQVDRAVSVGAKFIVSPGTNPKIVRHCIEKGIPITPGCSTATDIETALELGVDTVKFFPAEVCGGLKMIKALAGPFPMVKFVPTGGINAQNVKEYLASPYVLACGGTWMVKKELVNAGDFDIIEALAREAREIVQEARGGR